jgi:acetyl-CoA acetyltransferase
MRDVYVAGVGMTKFGRQPDRSLRDLSEDSVGTAIKDAGIVPGDIQTVFFGNAIAGLMTGQEMVRGQSALRGVGVLGVPIINVENACASASTAFNLAYQAVASGAVDVALAVGAEKMSHPDKNRAKEALATACDLEELAEVEARLGAEAGGERSFFMDLYANTARDYMAKAGATPEDFAAVSVKNRFHGSFNPHAQFTTSVTLEEVMGARMIIDPLTLLMCSAIGDGSAAVVLTSAERTPSDRPRVRIAATVMKSGFGTVGTAPHEMAGRRAALEAYDISGYGPNDFHVVECHDAAAPAELVLYEELMLCEEGGGAELLRSGATRLGGRMPVNTSGGLLAKGHPVGASGCAQIVELSEQLWGRAGARQVEGARVALAENGGGWIGSDSAAVVVTVLERQ